jgi:hypothetical protein
MKKHSIEAMEEARIIHDRIATCEGENETEACHECFQHQAQMDPCPACVVIADALAEVRAQCAVKDK